MSAGADTNANTLWGGGALEVGDPRLLEDGGERGGALVERLQCRSFVLAAQGERQGALVSDVVASEPVNERWSGDGERSGVSRGADTKANTLGAGSRSWRT